MVKTNTQVYEIRKSSLEKVAGDPVKSAKLFNLVYITDSTKGITRKKHGNTFRYFLNGSMIRDKETLDRIKKLVLPPAWENVWICEKENGHLQATGIDVKGRKQYRYHPLWNKMRTETKYFRLYEFGKNLPALRKQLEKDMALPGLQMNKILAAMVMLMERTSIRVGNSFYEKLYGSFGLTTLKNKHVDVKGTHIKFAFKGKKGVQQDISLRSKRLSLVVKKCLEIPGKELFQYYDDSGNRQPVDSGMLNEYIRQVSGSEFSSKDIRTWSGTICALGACLQKVESGETPVKRKTVEILDEVAEQLGNTRTVCKKYYVHPVVLELYEKDGLEKYADFTNFDDPKEESLFTPEEKILMKILEDHSDSGQVIQLSSDS